MENLLLKRLKELVYSNDYCLPEGVNTWNPIWGALTETQLKYDILVIHFPSNRFFSGVESTAKVSFYCRQDVVKYWGCSLNRRTLLYGSQGCSFFWDGNWSPQWVGNASNTELLTTQSQTCQCNNIGCIRPVCWPPPRVLKQATIKIKTNLQPNNEIENAIVYNSLSTYVIPGQDGVCSNAFNFNGTCTQPYIGSQIRTIFDTFYNQKGDYVRNNIVIDSEVSQQNTSLINYPIVLVREKKELKTNKRRNSITTNDNN